MSLEFARCRNGGTSVCQERMDPVDRYVLADLPGWGPSWSSTASARESYRASILWRPILGSGPDLINEVLKIV